MKSKDDLLRDLARSRDEVRQSRAAVGREFDVKAKLDAVVRRKPFAWLGGAAALGWILAGPHTKTRTITKIARHPGERPRTVKDTGRRAGALGFLIGLVRFLLPMIKPALTASAAKRLSRTLGDSR